MAPHLFFLAHSSPADVVLPSEVRAEVDLALLRFGIGRSLATDEVLDEIEAYFETIDYVCDVAQAPGTEQDPWRSESPL